MNAPLRFIVDAQLPPALAAFLRDKGHEAVALREIGLRDADDPDIWERARLDARLSSPRTRISPNWSLQAMRGHACCGCAPVIF
jgi:hypothetical protein